MRSARENPYAITYCRWYVTFIGLPSAPIGMFAVASFAVIANCSFSNSANATDLTETRRTSLKPSKRSNMVVRSSSSTSRGMFCKNRVLFGRTYSSGTTAAPVFAARGFSAATAGLACAFASSSARLKSANDQQFARAFAKVMRTLLHQPLPLVLVEHVCCLSLDRLVAVCFRLGYLQGLAIQLESSHLLDCLQCGLFAVKHNKRLALALQATFSNNVEYRAIVLKDFGESLLHGIDLNALFEIIDLVLLASRYGV
jgi:hypothetical protein